MERQTASHQELVADEASQSTLALNPLLSLRPRDLINGGVKASLALAWQPRVLIEQGFAMAAELLKIALGTSDLKADPRDRRFVDPAWTKSPVHRGILQAYLAWATSVAKVVREADISELDAARARLLSSILIDALAPSNNPLVNPTAIKTFIDTGGQSALRGIVNLLTDIAHNGGMPASVDGSEFVLGKNVAVSPGAVVFRNEVLELVQYAPATDQVYERPMIVVPPQINKYYSMDLAPEKSLIKYLVDGGIQPFCVSWRNPTAKQRDWGLATYVTALDEAVDAVRKIAGIDKVTMMGSCSGGVTLAAYLAWLAAQSLDKVETNVVGVCVLDVENANNDDFAALVTPETLELAKRNSARKGVLEGSELASIFAWMRPNDLIWNYWVNNYLLGNKPPAFDLLFWNADTTRLPARLHGDYIDMAATNPFVNPDRLVIDDVQINLAKVDVDTYVIAGTTDHITPWRSVYKTARLFGDRTTFVLSNSGHLQSLLNPPGNPKSWFLKGKASVEDPDLWMAKAEQSQDSWWPDWLAMLTERSGAKVGAPTSLGNDEYVPLAKAPGTYVLEA